MSLETKYKGISESTRILKWTVGIALLLNLSTIDEWLKQKEVSAATTPFIKLTEALKEIGDQFHLNSIRDGLRAQMFPKNLDVANENLVNPLVPDLGDPRRQLAAIEPSVVVPDADFDVSDLDVIEDLLDDDKTTETTRIVKDSKDVELGEDRKNILVIGDSILKSGLQEHFERNIARRDKNMTMEIKSRSGTGLSRPDVFDWIQYLENTKSQFDKVVIFLGTNDAQNLMIGKKIVTFDSKDWKAEYGLRVRTLLQKACMKAKQVYWVDSLKMKSDSFDAKMRALHEVVRKEIKGQSASCAQFISVANWFTKKSKYTDTWTTTSKSGKRTVKLRVADGIHMTYWGADLFSQKIIESIYE
ncbi:MAG: DUF459 domain-containing protein [Bdellovibrionaceae bacterium]|nr:DUF459 domain-containing protein [Pseudobdellovibrionaceae bacterium]